MTPEEMYQLFSAATPAAAENPVRRVAAAVRPAATMEKGIAQLRAIAEQCPRGNYANGRPMSYSSLKEFKKHPLYYLKYVQQAETPPTENQILGQIFENLLVRGVLPDNIVDADFRPVPDKDFRAAANADWRREIEAAGLTVAKPETIATGRAMAAMVKDAEFIRSFNRTI